MKEYLERILHQDIQLSDYKEINKLPLACRNTCDLQVMRIGNQECILAVPLETLNLTELRKQQRLLERFSGHYCALYLSNMNYYAKDKMIEEGIPFVWENHQIYLPFLGILLNQNDGRNPRNCEQISFLTQKLILIAIYENWKGVTVTQAAERLSVSKMSVTRCFDEIQVLGLPYLKIKNRARKF
ncbi:MAG: MarR family transcriptional regulator, partial [Anaerovoracaceae bacterium]